MDASSKIRRELERRTKEALGHVPPFRVPRAERSAEMIAFLQRTAETTFPAELVQAIISRTASSRDLIHADVLSARAVRARQLLPAWEALYREEQAQAEPEFASD